MKSKKIRLSILIAIVLTILFISVVVAGSSLDYGYVETKPPVGEVNWIAWFDNPGNTLDGGIPHEVVTEDSTNPTSGEDQGYQILTGSEPTWNLQVANMIVGKSHGQPIKMIFGGLGESSGKLWFYGYGTTAEDEFFWIEYPDHLTWHETIQLSERTERCPVTSKVGYDEDTKVVTFSGLPNSTFHVYRSQMPSGADNNASDGRYLYLKTETTSENGMGSFTDGYMGDSWYIVIRADPETNELLGCHSEEGKPTGTRVIDFKTEFDLAEKVIRLSWEKVANDVLGFNLYRSTSKDVEGNKIYSVWIGDPDADNEGLFSYVDDDALEFGETYYYTLEILGLDMSRENIRPMSISQRAGYSFFIPLIQEGN